MTKTKSSIVLIGMSGSGKSYFGEKLAKELKLPFIDSDELILRFIRPLSEDFYCLQNYIDRVGVEKFLELEQEILVELAMPGQRVIATGGSTSHSAMAMEELRKTSLMVHLDNTPDNLLENMFNLDGRGIIGMGKNSFEQFCKERSQIYRKYSDLIIVLKDIEKENVLKVILQRIDGYIAPLMIEAIRT